MKNYKLVIFGVKQTTKILIELLYTKGIQTDLIVSLDQDFVKKNSISGYHALESTARAIQADYYETKHYSLKHLSDSFFKENHFELGIAYGWQRLIPNEVLDLFRHGIFGFHASSEMLPKGTGRSPLNWGIISGTPVLYNHFFKYSSEADEGDVYSVTPFEINAYDTILTLQYKSLLIAQQEIIRLISDIKAGTLKLTSQQGEGYALPKRTSDDGLIHFSTSSTREIINLIRGVTHPFPGAFCFTNRGLKITIWEAWEFDRLMDFSHYKPGDVMANLYDMPIIKTLDGSIVLKQYEGCILNQGDTLIDKANGI